ncbi:MarR family winged helix-turn-helix transcriptional regulator [Methylobacillus flagellatus]|uniref:MarR family winged helix-turn-helix transcriptional regulator n=1 Tax=Methylobacillus flagellatus TaxID=405 RepID=UPI0010F4693F|nr:MarR family transcriptional regulator [Methylobacillus flagellatus]
MDNINTPAIADLSPERLLCLDIQMCFALYSASLSMSKIYKPLLAELGLTYPQYLVMLALWAQNEQTVGELGERLFLDSGTLTPLLKRLEKLDYIQRVRSKQDERRVIVTLTERGDALRQQAVQVPVQIAAKTGCTLQELQSLNEQLTRLRSRLIANL